MIILSIESSCDETAASLIEVSGKKLSPRIRVLSNIVSSQVKIHARYGGVVPEVAARRHAEVIVSIIEKVLSPTFILPPMAIGGRREGGVDLIAVTYGPGLITSLRVGVDAAKTLAYVWKKPLIHVNHIEGHIYSNWLTPDKKAIGSATAGSRQGGDYKLKAKSSINFPALVLVVSGGHTELILMKDHGKYRIIGQTLDDAVGEAFDKVAKILGLGYPGGPVISALADRIKNPRTRTSSVRGRQELRIKALLPRPMIDSPDFDFSFAGLKTAVLYKFRELEKLYSKKELAASFAYEFQNAAVEVLVAKTVRAAKEFKVKIVMLAGGVSANKKLRLTLEKAISEIGGLQYIQPSLDYTTDNAAMIAVAGYFNYIRTPEKYKNGWKKIKVDPNLSITRTLKH